MGILYREISKLREPEKGLWDEYWVPELKLSGV